MHQDDKAIDAIWKTDMESSQEKLVLYHLASKHELGDRYSSAWKSVDRFIEDLEPRWCAFKDIKTATQLSEIKLQRTIEGLLKKGYIERHSSQDPKANHELEHFAITSKLFEEYRTVLGSPRKSRQA